MAARSPQPQPRRSTRRRAIYSFWILVAATVLATGVLSSALAAAPGPLTGLRVAASGLILLGSLTFATRLMIAIERARQRARRAQT